MLDGQQGEADSQKWTGKGPQGHIFHGLQIFQRSQQVPPSFKEGNYQGKTNHSCHNADLCGFKGVHVLHPLLTQDQSCCLTKGPSQCQYASKEQWS